MSFSISHMSRPKEQYYLSVGQLDGIEPVGIDNATSLA